MNQETILVSAIQSSPQERENRRANLDYILETLRAEAAGGSQLVVFPEVSLTNFFRHGSGGVKSLWEQLSVEVDGPDIEEIADLVRALGVYTVVGFNERAPILGVVYNSAALIGPEGIVGISRKQNFPGIEKLYYTPGPRLETFDCALGRVGVVICYDTLFPEIARHHFRNGVDILICVSSFWRGGAKGGSGDPVTKAKLWKELPFVTAVQNQAFVVSANCSGTLDLGPSIGEWERLGMSQIVSPHAGVLAFCEHNEPQILRAELKRSELLEARFNYRFLAESQLGARAIGAIES
ncbi:MAG: carbon-nitrogen hydrolase family protein [Devosia sp.]